MILKFRVYRGVGFMMLGDDRFARRYRKNRPDIYAKLKKKLNIKSDKEADEYYK